MLVGKLAWRRKGFWMAVEGKIVVWDMKPSVLVDGYGRFGATCCRHLQDEWLRDP